MGILGMHDEADIGRKKVRASHAGGYSATEGVELVAIADVDEAKLDRFGEAWEIPPDRRYVGHEAMLAEDPLRDLVGSIGDLTPDQRTDLVESLSHLAASLAGTRQTRAFGTCSDCTHFTPEGDSGYCACMAVALAGDEIDKLCASYDGPVRAGQLEEGPSNDRQ